MVHRFLVGLPVPWFRGTMLPTSRVPLTTSEICDSLSQNTKGSPPLVLPDLLLFGGWHLPRNDFTNSRYDYNEIYSGSSKDERGSSSNLRCKIPDSWAAQISRLAYDSEWPEYDTPQGFIRDAIYHRLHWVSQQRESGREMIATNIAQLMTTHQMQEDLLLDSKMRGGFQEMKKTIEARFTEMLADGDIAALRSFIVDFESRIDMFREPYQSQLKRELKIWEGRIVNR